MALQIRHRVSPTLTTPPARSTQARKFVSYGLNAIIWPYFGAGGTLFHAVYKITYYNVVASPKKSTGGREGRGTDLENERHIWYVRCCLFQLLPLGLKIFPEENLKQLNFVIMVHF